MSIQKSYTALDNELTKLQHHVDDIVKSGKPTSVQAKELNKVITMLSSRLQDIRSEQASVLMERRAGEASAKSAALSAHGDKIMGTINSVTKTLREKNQKLRSEQEHLVRSVGQQRQILSSNQSNFKNYSRALQNKMELLATRDRMLQLSQERNVYKKKVIYVLFAIIIALLVAIIAAYTFFRKTRS